MGKENKERKEDKTKRNIFNLHSCINQIKIFFKVNKPGRLRSIAEECVQEFGISKDNNIFYASLIAYSLSKIIQKPRYKKIIPELSSKINKKLDNAIAQAKAEKTAALRGTLGSIMIEIASMEKVDERFVSNVIEKGRLKIAAVLYAQGLSLDTAVSLTGARRNEVLEYTGGTLMADRFGKTLSAKERLTYARKLLK